MFAATSPERRAHRAARAHEESHHALLQKLLISDSRLSDQKRANKRASDSFMQLYWEQGQQACHTLKGSCYSERRCEVCGTFCHIMWRLLEIHVRLCELLGGWVVLEGACSSVEAKWLCFLRSGDDGNRKIQGGVEVRRLVDIVCFMRGLLPMTVPQPCFLTRKQITDLRVCQNRIWTIHD